MKKFWYLPIAAVAGAASLTVWAQANAGPPPAVSPGVVVSDVSSGSGTEVDDSPSSPAASTPSVTAIPDPAAAGTQLVPAELQTYGPDDKGGLRDDNVSDDGPTHDLYDDKGGLRDDNVSDDGPTHDLFDDKGGLRADNESDDGPTHDLYDDKGGER